MFDFVKNYSWIKKIMEPSYDWVKIFAKEQLRKLWHQLAIDAMEIITNLDAEDIENSEKRELAAKRLNDKHDIPYVPEWLEGLVFRGVLEVVFIIKKTLNINDNNKNKGL